MLRAVRTLGSLAAIEVHERVMKRLFPGS